MDLLKPIDLGDVASVGAVVISLLALLVSVFTWQKERNRHRVLSVVDLQRRWTADLAKHRDVLISLIDRINRSDGAANADGTAGGPTVSFWWESGSLSSTEEQEKIIQAARAHLAFAMEVLQLRGRKMITVRDIRQIFSAEGIPYMSSFQNLIDGIKENEPQSLRKKNDWISRFAEIINHPKMRDLVLLSSTGRR